MEMDKKLLRDQVVLPEEGQHGRYLVFSSWKQASKQAEKAALSWVKRPFTNVQQNGLNPTFLVPEAEEKK